MLTAGLRSRHRLFPAALVALAISALTLGPSPVAEAAGESPHDYQIQPGITSHFYDVSITRIETPVGQPYITAVDERRTLSLDWDFEIGATDLVTREVQQLGILPLPAGARPLDFQYFGEDWPATSSRFPVIVSYAALDPTSGCRHLWLREASIDRSGAGANTLGRVWFKSPCFGNVDDGEGPVLAQSGGRIALVPPSQRTQRRDPEFYLGVGDFKIMKPYPVKLSKAARTVLGTVVRVTAPGEFEVWSRGLRNAQGVVAGIMDGKPAVFATSQGPRGGDEIVLAAQGSDFGWPRVSYGTGYAGADPSKTPDAAGRKGKYDKPIFAWTPSIGLSDAIQVRGPAFKRWWGSQGRNGTPDLIVSGMGARWLYRVRIDDGAVRYSEGLYVGARVRSMAQLPSGVIVAGLDDGREFIVLRPAAVWNEGQAAKVPL